MGAGNGAELELLGLVLQLSKIGCMHCTLRVGSELLSLSFDDVTATWDEGA